SIRYTFIFQAEDGIRDRNVTGVQTCALPIYFENVGGAVADAVFPLLNTYARVPVCGLVSQYNATAAPEGPDRLPGFYQQVLVKRSEEHTSELQSRFDIGGRLLVVKQKCNRLR